MLTFLEQQLIHRDLHDACATEYKTNNKQINVFLFNEIKNKNNWNTFLSPQNESSVEKVHSSLKWECVKMVFFLILS